MWFIIPIVLKTSIPEFGVALTAFVIFEAAYLGEIVRAGIQSVPRGQVEAATAVGLSGTQSMRFVVLPQALAQHDPVARDGSSSCCSRTHRSRPSSASWISPRPPRS
jgi:ABC-type amino acid transport system permease subunit